MQTNVPEIVAEVTEQFMRYEKALGSNDLDTLDAMFWDDPRTLRYGPNGTLVGHAQISAFRRRRDIDGIKRTLKNTVVTTFGRDFAVANTETERHGTGLVTRQSQTWVRLPQGWCIVSAHVSEEASRRSS